jgi:hypothetical protein
MSDDGTRDGLADHGVRVMRRRGERRLASASAAAVFLLEGRVDAYMIVRAPNLTNGALPNSPCDE